VCELNRILHPTAHFTIFPNLYPNTAHESYLPGQGNIWIIPLWLKKRSVRVEKHILLFLSQARSEFTMRFYQFYDKLLVFLRHDYCENNYELHIDFIP